MRIDKGHYGDTDLAGVKFAGIVHWPGPIHEGNGEAVPVIDESADEKQREAILTIMCGQAGDLLFEILAAKCSTFHEPIFVPVDFEFDLEERSSSVHAGDGVLEMEVETLRGIDPPDAYRVIVKIPNGAR